MKKIFITVCTLLAVCSVSLAQSKNDLKGPKAKNYKVWQDDSKSATVYTDANRSSITGPEAKNRKPWADSAADENKVAIKRDTRKSSLKGPAAKNFKPWN